jgi:hypothetical protein
MLKHPNVLRKAGLTQAPAEPGGRMRYFQFSQMLIPFAMFSKSSLVASLSSLLRRKDSLPAITETVSLGDTNQGRIPVQGLHCLCEWNATRSR